MFFFEKKNQKTFVSWVSFGSNGAFKNSKVFCFFFSKKKCFLFCLNDTHLTVWLVISIFGGAASATQVPANYYYAGNVQAVGQGSCSAINGVFPTHIYYFQDNVTYAVTTLWANLSIYNNTPVPNSPPGTVTLPLQTLLLTFTLPSQAYNVFDPQLFGTTAYGFGSYTGTLTISSGSAGDYIEFGTNFLQKGATPLTLTSGTCVIQLQGILPLQPL